jgi:hypothetical protein
MFPKTVKYKIGQKVWCQFESGGTMVSTIKAIFIQPNGDAWYYIHAYKHCVSESNLSNSDAIPEMIKIITPSGA